MYPIPSLSENIIFAVTLGVSAAMSIVGSSAIIFNVLRQEKKLVNTHHRLIFALSCVDIISSTATGFTSFPTPQDSSNVLLTFGNTITCAVQGFAITIGTAVPFYNMFLNLNFMLIICYKVKEEYMSKKIEPFMHIFSVGYGISAAVGALLLNNYNKFGHMCWIAPYPTGCRHNDIECTRGIHASKYRIGLTLVITINLIMIVAMTIITTMTVWKYEKKMEKYNHFSNDDCQRVSLSNIFSIKQRQYEELEVHEKYQIALYDFKKTKAVAIKGLSYTLVSLIVWLVPAIIGATASSYRMRNSQHFDWTTLLSGILHCSQGLLNFVVYIRLDVIKIRKKNPEYKLHQAIYEAIVHPERHRRPSKKSRRRSSDIRPSTVQMAFRDLADAFDKENEAKPDQGQLQDMIGTFSEKAADAEYTCSIASDKNYADNSIFTDQNIKDQNHHTGQKRKDKHTNLDTSRVDEEFVESGQATIYSISDFDICLDVNKIQI